MLELVVRLVLVGGVLVAALFGLRWAQQRGMTARGGPSLRVMGRTGIAKDVVVAVVAVDDRRFLVGTGQGGVELLAELDRIPMDDYDEDELDADLTALLNGQDAPRPTPWAQRTVRALSSATSSATSPLDAHGSGVPTSGPRIGPLDRLREMTVRTHLREPIRDEEPSR